MRWAISVVAVLLVFLVACSPRRNGPPGRGPGGDAMMSRGGGLAGDPYRTATAMISSGRCDTALPILVCLARQGPGYEMALHDAGVCHGRQGDEDLQQDAWLRAASAGWGASQAALAQHYFDAGDMEAAAVWAGIYQRNLRERSLGLNRLQPGVLNAATRLDDESRAAVQGRVDQFRSYPLTAELTGPDCLRVIGRPDVSGPRPGGGRRGPGRSAGAAQAGGGA